MFDHVVLNVVTGLVFIYLLYSLLVTVSVEFFSYKLGLRPRLLRFAIERMLNDGYYEKIEKNMFQRARTSMREWQKKSILSKKQRDVAALQASNPQNIAHLEREKDIVEEWEEKGVPDNMLSWYINWGAALINFLEWVLIGWWGWLRRFLLYETIDFKTSFAGKFYDYPSIKYLTKIEAKHKKLFNNTKPSYFSGENFADTLANMLKDKGVGTTDAEKVDFCLTFNPYYVQTETLKQLRNLWKDAAKDVPTFKAKLKQWFEETMDRTNGWYKQKMQLVSLILGFVLAASFNVDSLKITRILAKDKDAREQLVQMSVALANDTTRYQHYTTPTADSTREQHVDSVYTLLQKDISAANAILGLGWNLGSLQKDRRRAIDLADEDETEIFNALMADKKSFASMDSIATLAPRFERRKKERDSLMNVMNVLVADSALIHEELVLITPPDTARKVTQQAKTQTKPTPKANTKTAKPKPAPVDPVAQELTNIKTRAQQKRTEISKAQIGIRLAKLKAYRDSMALQMHKAITAALHAKINTLAGEEFLTITSVKVLNPNNKKTAAIRIDGKVTWGFWAKLWYWLGCVFGNFWGLFITAVALSFGAPFWFDILKKIVALRTAGVKPEEKPIPKDQSIVTNTTPVVAPVAPIVVTKSNLVTKGKDLVEEALRIHGSQIKAIAGVKSVMVFVSDVAKKTKQLQINVIDTLTESAVKAKFASLDVDGQKIAPVIKVAGQPSTHQGPGVIHPKLSAHNAGSVGCVLKKSDNNSLHILSCWHVLKDLGNRHQSTSIVHDHNDKGLGDRWAGGISGAFDYGLARCFASASINSNKMLKKYLRPGKNQVSVRSIIDDDVNTQMKVQYVDFLANPPVVKTGQLFTVASSVEVNYADGVRNVDDVLVITKDPSNTETISQPGNSGALVFDKDFRAIGMIIAGDLHFTYAVKLSNIFNLHKDMTIV